MRRLTFRQTVHAVRRDLLPDRQAGYDLDEITFPSAQFHGHRAEPPIPDHERPRPTPIRRLDDSGRRHPCTRLLRSL